MKTKRKMRQEAVERLKSAISVEGEHLSYGRVIEVLSGRPTYTEWAGVYAETLIDLLTDDDMDEYVKLPVDANGEVIHIGDEMERVTKRGRVIALMLSNYPQKWGGGLHWGVQLEGEQAPTALDNLFHHYKRPTVEDVLREFSDEVQRCCDTEDTIAEYAKKLQLREEGCE